MNGPERSEGPHENAHGAAGGRRDGSEPGEHRESGTGGRRGPDGSGGRFGPPDGTARSAGHSGAVPGPRIPTPRTSVEDSGLALPGLAGPGDLAPVPPPDLSHDVLRSLLGAWALAACSAAEAAAVEDHLGGCGSCADEARRLSEAVGLLHQPESLDLDPGLRTRVLESCLRRRPPRIPVPDWAAPYDAETARLDALLQDFGKAEWEARVELRWFENDTATSRRTTVAGVLAHLLAVDGLIAAALGLADPLAGLRGTADRGAAGPAGRTEAYWRAAHPAAAHSVRGPWREQSHALVRTVSFTGSHTGRLPVSYGDFTLPLHDAMLDRAFECWVHAEDIAKAVHYPYPVPVPRHLHRMIDLAARVLPTVLAERRRAGLSEPGRSTPHLVPAGAPGRSLRLEIEGDAGGEWLIPLDSPAARGSAELEVAHVVLDGVEFCQLAAGHVSPEDAAAGQDGDRRAIRDVLYAAASLGRM
ncbi:zf-HC2 domain-containing protein [Streptomyces sp. NPDC017638]|uniref:zf-HC2 domain-containing protein n=1 Tax=Streptomyces sp. NPDC017638 TaxID=3365004 RepID=UPI0037ACFF74